MRYNETVKQLFAEIESALGKNYEIEVRTHWFGHFYFNAVPAKVEGRKT